jgi:hypothetical protein
LFLYTRRYEGSNKAAKLALRKPLEVWRLVLDELRRNVVTMVQAYTTIMELDDVGHFAAMQSLQLASLMGLIQLHHFKFAAVSTGNFGTCLFLQRYSSEFDGLGDRPTK